MDTDRNTGKPSVLLSRTTANQNTRNALRSLVEHEMLAEFWTTFAWDANSSWDSILPARLRTQLARRSVGEAPAHQVRTAPWREMVRLALRGTPLENFFCSGERPFSVVAMSRNFDRRVAHRVRELRPDIVYAYDGGALQTFRQAKKLGVTAVYEHTSGYWQWERKVYVEEAERNPEFAALLPGPKDANAHLEWKEEELQLADYIFVSSQHVRETFRGVVADEKVRVITYGAPPIRSRKRVPQEAPRPLKVLFVGSLNQRKGISYLLDAIEMLGDHAELTLVGSRFYRNSKVDEACRRHRWIDTLSHFQVLKLMEESDVLVLPSLSDAFGLVVTEGLACGLPVIVTPNTGASEIIVDGREGYVVPICRADIIACRLEALHSDREMLGEMSRQAQVTAAQNSWEYYRAQWARMIRSLQCN